MASTNTQFSIAVHVLAAIANYETSFTSEELAGSVNANPVFVKRVLAKLSKARLVQSTVGKSGGYALAMRPRNISLLDIYSAVNPPSVFAVHCYPSKKGCIVSANVKEVLRAVLADTQGVLERDLKRTTLENIVERIKERDR